MRRAPARTAPRCEKAFPGWPACVGPPPASACEPRLLLRAPEEEACFLLGAWRLLQRTDAHRYSTDDVVTAWVAWRVGRALGLGGGPLCDLGCGLGSVLLMCVWLHPSAAAAVGAEAQPRRLSLAQRSIAFNVGGARVVTAVGGDLREPATHAALRGAAGGGPFSLVTGTPPYFDVAAGGTPPHEESARCLFEYRGGVEAYCAAAAALLAPGGAFCVCETSLALHRAYEGAATAGLAVLARVDVVPAPGKPPLFFVLVCGRKAGAEGARAALRAPATFFSPLPLSALPHEDMRVPAGDFAAYYAAIGAQAAGGGGSGGGGGGGAAGDGGGAPPAAAAEGGRKKKPRLPPHAALQGVALGSEAVFVVHVRRGGGAGRTPQFRYLLAELGKPSD